MTTSYRPYHPDQALLLPASPQDWLPEGHLAYFISDATDALDLSAFHQRYEGDGRRRQPYDPAMMVKVLVYAYASGVFSSRKISRCLEQDVAFRVLGADNFPAHRTIREFRRLHLEEFTALFVQIVKLARESGLIKLGYLGIDGTKVKANASKRKAMSYGRMKQREEGPDRPMIQNHPDVQLATDGQLFLHQDSLHNLAFESGLMRDQTGANEPLRQHFRRLRRRGQHNPTGLPAAARVNLGLQYDGAAQPLGGRPCLDRCRHHLASWDRHPVRAQDCLRLKLMNLHSGSCRLSAYSVEVVVIRR